MCRAQQRAHAVEERGGEPAFSLRKRVDQRRGIIHRAMQLEQAAGRARPTEPSGILRQRLEVLRPVADFERCADGGECGFEGAIEVGGDDAVHAAETREPCDGEVGGVRPVAVEVPEHFEVVAVQLLGERLRLIFRWQLLLLVASQHERRRAPGELVGHQGRRGARERPHDAAIEVAPRWQIRRRCHRDAGAREDHQA